MDKNIKNPEIRFKGSMTDWQANNFYTVFSFLSNNTLSRADLNYRNGLAKNIHYGDVLIKFKEILDVQNNEIPFISNNELIHKFKTSKLQDGDVIFADAAEDETVGKCTEIDNIYNEIIYPGLHTIAVRPNFLFASFFLGYYLNSPAYHNQLLRLMQGTKVLSISKSAINKTIIWHPYDINEQTQIGTFFKNLDNLITSHQKKYNKLVILKKAMLVKMFTSNGAIVPEIRFKGFNQDWQEKQLGKVSESYSGGTPSASTSIFYNGNIPFIRSGEINSHSTKLYISEIGLKNSSAKMVDIGTILYALYGATSGTVAISKINGAINQAVLAIIPDKIIDSEFLMQWLSKEKSKITSTYLQGGQGNLSGGIVKDLLINMPGYEEQKKIGDYFKNLDKQIKLLQIQVQKLNNIKKACLTKMFVIES